MTSARDPPNPRIVCKPETLADFIYYISKKHTTISLVIICSDRQSFIKRLAYSCRRAELVKAAGKEQHVHPLFAASIDTMTSALNVALAFCDSVQALHAYLTTLPRRTTLGDKTFSHLREGHKVCPTLVIVDCLRLHGGSGYYSAQGLSQAFAAAVEAADRSEQRLVLFESNDGPLPIADRYEVDSQLSNEETDIDRMQVAEDVGEEAEHERVQFGGTRFETQPVATQHERHEGLHDHMLDSYARMSEPMNDPWAVELPVINSTVRKFGSTGDRAWMDRKVKAADVVARWFLYEDLLRDAEDQH